MTEKTNVPEIRFAGFTDPWEQRKLGDICERHKEMVPTPKDGYVRMGVRSHAKGTFLTMVKPGAEIEEKELSRVKAHCLVVNIVFAWEQAIAITSTEDEKALVSHRFPQFLFHDDMHPDYFRYAILNDSFERHLWLASPSGAGRNKTLNVGTMLEYSFTLPNKKEQEAIASCLTRLDSLITLHQRKHDKLVQLKKSMLDKMFPKPGETEPEIRFAGFTDPWEQRKLGDVAAVYDGVHQTPDYQDEGVMFLSVENIATLTSQKFISREAFARDYPVYPKRGDVLMTRIGDIGTSNVVETDDKLAFYVSLALLKPFNVDSYYLDKSLQSPSAKMELYRRTLHIAFPKKINKNQIAEVMLPIPRSRQEQEQIGALFRNLDTLITLHQRKLELLRNTKKSLLERMFV